MFASPDVFADCKIVSIDFSDDYWIYDLSDRFLYKDICHPWILHNFQGSGDVSGDLSGRNFAGPMASMAFNLMVAHPVCGPRWSTSGVPSATHLRKNPSHASQIHPSGSSNRRNLRRRSHGISPLVPMCHAPPQQFQGPAPAVAPAGSGSAKGAPSTSQR